MQMQYCSTLRDFCTWCYY